MGVALFDHRRYCASWAADVKGDRRVTVCIPALDEVATIGAIVAAIRAGLVEQDPVVDEIVVIDDGSTDGTALEAMAAGATVVAAAGAQPGRPTGKGGAMATGTAHATGDIVVFLDADVTNFDCHFVTGLVGPLLEHPELVMTKATYRRSLRDAPGEGGRVNTLVARPLLARCFPELAILEQPLAGECAIRTSALRDLELAPGYGVEVAMLIDVAQRYTAGAIAQVDLGERAHRNRPLQSLATHATQILDTVLDRYAVVGVAVA